MSGKPPQFERAVRLSNEGADVAALEIAEDLAADGHIESMILCADIYLRGSRVERDIHKARTHLEKAASLGSKVALEILSLVEKAEDLDVRRFYYHTMG